MLPLSFAVRLVCRSFILRSYFMLMFPLGLVQFPEVFTVSAFCCSVWVSVGVVVQAACSFQCCFISTVWFCWIRRNFWYCYSLHLFFVFVPSQCWLTLLWCKLGLGRKLGRSLLMFFFGCNSGCVKCFSLHLCSSLRICWKCSFSCFGSGRGRALRGAHYCCCMLSSAFLRV